MKAMILMTFLAACQSAPRPPVADLREPLAARRAQMLEWLREYKEAGVYPMDEAGLPLSVFKDARGVRCPMAELIYRSGHADLVEAVAREDNDVRLADVTSGPLYDWMLGSGLTLEEIAMVQGVADIDVRWMPREEATILARGELRGRLETAERALRDGTRHSLDVATSRLPDGRVPRVTVGNRVVPETAKKPRITVRVSGRAVAYP